VIYYIGEVSRDYAERLIAGGDSREDLLRELVADGEPTLGVGMEQVIAVLLEEIDRLTAGAPNV
jgi:hypothetical protein